MSSEQNPRQSRYRKGRYTVEERNIIEPFKDAFRSPQESKAGRLEILKHDILPAIFNYWQSIDGVHFAEEESRKRAKVSYQACSTLHCIIDHIARN